MVFASCLLRIGRVVGIVAGYAAAGTIAIASGYTVASALSASQSPTTTVPPATTSPPVGTRAPTAGFWGENDAAMATMMAAMTIPSSGDVDADFVATMIPHHEGAIAMARAELRHGQNESLRRLAQEIVVTQQQEIATMRQALEPLVGKPIPTPSIASSAPTSGPTVHSQHPLHSAQGARR